jgi:hypothetical protein
MKEVCYTFMDSPIECLLLAGDRRQAIPSLGRLRNAAIYYL